MIVSDSNIYYTSFIKCILFEPWSSECDYSSLKKSQLQVHVQIKHQNIKYTCDQCDYVATQPLNLSKHKKIVHEGFQIQCDQCEQKFTRRVTLKRHRESVHEGIREGIAIIRF